MNYSIIQYCSEHEKYKCGYCKRSDSNYSHGMWAHMLRAIDYQNLINRGWRRSGKYCYKPTNDIICCPMYTIRCKALEFKPSKSQKKVFKKVNKYLIDQDNVGGTSRKMSSSSEDVAMDHAEGDVFVENKSALKNIDLSKVDFTTNELTKDLKANSESSQSKEPEKKVNDTKDAGPDPTKAPCKKAKLMRRERRLEKLKQRGVDVSQLSDVRNKEKGLEDYIDELPDDVRKKLELRLVRTAPPSAEWKATSKQTYELYVKYQTTVHGDKPEKCTETQFREFLVESPLLEEYTDAPPCGYGSFHHQYWLEGRLVAVGVIDILPQCVSSVYFFYDPQYMFLTLGTYGALREVSLTRHLHTLSPPLQYYYLGFYIHSCPKMRYKSRYRPSELLCPETYRWFSIDGCLAKLDASIYCRFDSDLDSVDANHPTPTTYLDIPVLFHSKIKLYKEHSGEQWTTDDAEDLQQYATLVGARLAKKMILVK